MLIVPTLSLVVPFSLTVIEMLPIPFPREVVDNQSPPEVTTADQEQPPSLVTADILLNVFAELLAQVDAMVLDAGGRHYLAKDSHASPSAVRRGYPRLEEWKHTRDEMDPMRVWRSDLSRRLSLIDQRRSL